MPREAMVCAESGRVFESAAGRAEFPDRLTARHRLDRPSRTRMIAGNTSPLIDERFLTPQAEHHDLSGGHQPLVDSTGGSPDLQRRDLQPQGNAFDLRRARLLFATQSDGEVAAAYRDDAMGFVQHLQWHVCPGDSR
jgi:hypothetical protein